MDGFADDRAAAKQCVHTEVLAARLPRYGELDEPLPDPVGAALPSSGLWTHQAAAINLARAGASVVVATGTASGKSLCFQVPVAEAASTGLRAGTSLLLYPTKALAHDQLRSIEQMPIERLVAATYDGDADRDHRTWARRNANVILTNPEMLHYGILPHHRRWSDFLRRLDYVVVDELHVLRGVFGTHVGQVLRRLRRVCAEYGTDPTFIFTSATIGEPATLAAELCAKPVVTVDDDGSPRPPRRISIVAPSAPDGRRTSPVTETIRCVTDLVLADRRVIAFCASRSLTERVAAGVARALPAERRGEVQPYRSGYLAAERRQVEDDLAEGRIRAVVTTSALELGVDIGGLDAAVLCGFPGTIASFWQQVGRAGRGDRAATAVLVAGDDQLDQWFVKHPEDLFERPAEPAVVNLSNPHVLDPHLSCAAFETPLSPLDEAWWPDLDDGVRRAVLADDLRIRPAVGGRGPHAIWSGRGLPSNRIGLRSVGGGEVRIVDEAGSSIGSVERSRAAVMVHPGAVYLHRGQAWRVLDLDLDTGTAVVAEDDGQTWTQARREIGLDVLASGPERTVGRARLFRGEVRVTTQVVGYTTHRLGSSGSAGSVEALDLPPDELDTTAIWYQWEPETIAAAGIADFRLPGALHAAEHAAIGILPLFAICDRSDVGGVSIAAADHSGLPTVFIHDGYPGGAGMADLAFEAAQMHLAATLDVLTQCDCTQGCPSCVQSPKCGNGNEPLDKAAATALLATTLGTGEAF